MRQTSVTIQIAPHSSFRDPFLDMEHLVFAVVRPNTYKIRNTPGSNGD